VAERREGRNFVEKPAGGGSDLNAGGSGTGGGRGRGAGKGKVLRPGVSCIISYRTRGVGRGVFLERGVSEQGHIGKGNQGEGGE